MPDSAAGDLAGTAAGGDEPSAALPSLRGSGDGRPETRTWLLLVYRVPSEPTRLRATVWRRLRSLGAVYLQNSVSALPDGAGSERAMRKLRHDIMEMGGTAVLLRSEALLGEADVVGAFQSARNDEYEEIVDRCRDFLRQIQKEHVAEHFTFAELEENEVDLVKLQAWLSKVTGRDVLASPGRGAAEAAVSDCEKALEGYASRVYEADPHAH